MNVRTLITKTATTASFAAMIIFSSACAHHDATTADNDFGHVGQDGATTQVSSTSPTPIPGPAKVDSDGRAYTSSSVGSTGNADNVGTNTNVNIVPKKVTGSTDVTYTQTAVAPVAPLTTETTIVETTPAPIVTTPVVTETETTTTTTAPMISSSTVTEQSTTTDTTTSTTKTTHRRMRKD